MTGGRNRNHNQLPLQPRQQPARGVKNRGAAAPSGDRQPDFDIEAHNNNALVKLLKRERDKNEMLEKLLNSSGTKALKMKNSNSLLAQTRKCAKEKLYRVVKFITTPAQQLECMEWIYNELNLEETGVVPLEQKESYKITYQTAPTKAIADRRNYNQSEMKKVAYAWMSKLENNSLLPTVDEILTCALRKCACGPLFDWYVDVLVPTVVGTKEFIGVEWFV